MTSDGTSCMGLPKCSKEDNNTNTNTAPAEDFLQLDSVNRFAHNPIKVGQFFKGCDKKSYEVRSIICYNPYGEMIRVDELSSKKQFIVRTEVDELPNKLQTLKREVMFLDRARQCADKRRNRFFPVILDRARMKKEFKFVAFKTMGPDLDTYRRHILSKNFSRSTAMRLSVMILRTISNVHFLGYVHRDIRPCHFLIGSGPTDYQQIFLVDFSKIGKYRNDNGTIRTKKSRVSDVVYTHHKFLSRRAQKGSDPGRRDDLESWAYVTIDLFDDKILTWSKEKSKTQMLQKKKDFFKTGSDAQAQMVKVVAPTYKIVIEYINELSWGEDVQFGVVENAMFKISKTQNLLLSGPSGLDWAEKPADLPVPAPMRPKPKDCDVKTICSSGPELGKSKEVQTTPQEKPTKKKAKKRNEEEEMQDVTGDQDKKMDKSDEHDKRNCEEKQQSMSKYKAPPAQEPDDPDDDEEENSGEGQKKERNYVRAKEIAVEKKDRVKLHPKQQKEDTEDDYCNVKWN